MQSVNRTYRRTGTLWESRHKASLVEAERYLLACYRYIELNPVRANMVLHPADYPWSSFRAHAYGESDPLVCEHPLFKALGADSEAQAAAYRELFRYELASGLVHEIRKSARFSVPLGNDRFRDQVEHALGRSVGHAGRGRPVKRRSE